MAKYFEDELLLRLISEGKTYSEICNILNCTRNTILLNAKRLGVKVQPKNNKKDDKVFLGKIDKLLKLGKTTLEISAELKISPKTIRKYIKYLGKETNSVKYKSIKNINLTDEQLEVIYGSLLGDLCITKTKNLARFAISQGGDHEAYFDHLCTIFPSLLGKINKTPRFDKRTNKTYNKYSVRSLAHKQYLDIYHEIYKDGIKTITKEWVDKLTPRSIAYWFMDDGSRRGVFATNCFTKEECEILQEMFLVKFNIKTRLYNPPILEQYTLCVEKDSLNDFEDLIEPYIIPSMKYKLIKSELDPKTSLIAGNSQR